MPKIRFVKEIREGESVRDRFLVANKALLTTNAGKPYLSLTLRDKTGSIEGRVWDKAEEIGKRFERDDVVEVSGQANAFQNKLQMKVFDAVKVPDGALEIDNYLPVAKKGIEPLWAELQALVASVADPHLSALLKRVFPPVAVEGTVAAKFRRAPGGKSMHHDYIGGLMEHTVSAATIVKTLAVHYEGVSGDLLVAGTLLHDIGKVEEMSYSGSFEYTDVGRLLGHIFIGAEMIGRECEAIPGFPKEMAILLTHMILSHHGELEYGSPKRPKTVEAIILHFIENMDAKVNAYFEAMDDLREGARWTDYMRMFERPLFTGKFPAE